MTNRLFKYGSLAVVFMALIFTAQPTEASGWDYDLAIYLRPGVTSTEGRFAREMQTRLDAESDPERRKTLENALYYGLDALVQKDVVPRYED